MSGLTRRQRDCLNAIRALTDDGVSPTIDELATHLGDSKGNVHRILRGLRERGAIRWRDHCARSIEIVGPKLPSPGELKDLPLDDLDLHLGHVVGAIAGQVGWFELAHRLERIKRAMPRRVANG